MSNLFIGSGETQEVKAVLVERHLRSNPGIEYPSYGHAMLAALGMKVSPDTAQHIEATRHLATENALNYLKNTLARIDQHGEFMSRSDIGRRYNKALAVAQHFLSIEAKWAEVDDGPATKKVHKMFDQFMGMDGSNPTYISVTGKAVDVLTDNALAAEYLGRMLEGETFSDHWQPVVDWAALNYVGGVAFIDEDTPHNGDITTMKAWRNRFAAYPIGDQIEDQLAMIDEMREYPMLFDLPIPNNEHTWPPR
jgi:hypothetical protein